MPEPSEIRREIEAAVEQALDAARTQITTNVAQLVAGRSQLSNSKQLLAGVKAVESGVSQTEVLTALLAASEPFAGRAALLLVRGSSVVVWQGRSYADALRGVVIDASAGPVARAIHSRTAVECGSSELPAQLASGGRGLLVPLVVRDKIAALFFADAASDEAAVELLVRAAGSWIELTASRKSLGHPVAAPQNTTTAAPQPNVQSVAATQSASATPPVPAIPVPAPVAPSVAPSTTAGSNPGTPGDEIHGKARRFAKLLVDELRLYNQAKVAAGKQSLDLYDRLKDDIEKSREAYNRRFANTAAASTDYFTEELIRGLADGNRRVLGPNF